MLDSSGWAGLSRNRHRRCADAGTISAFVVDEHHQLAVVSMGSYTTMPPRSHVFIEGSGEALPLLA